MSPIRLAVVLAAPLLFAVLPLVSLVVPWGGVLPERDPGTVLIVRQDDGDEDAEPVTFEVRSTQDTFVYVSGAKAQRDCSQWSNSHIDG